MVEHITENDGVRSSILRPGTRIMLNQIDLTKLFDPNLIFEATPSPEGLYLDTLAIYGLLLSTAVILGIISRRNPQSVYKNLWRKFIYLSLFTGIIGPVLIFFRWQSIPYLGSRLAVLALWITTLFWLLQIIWYWLIILPREIKAKQEKENFEKYLPRQKSI